MLDLRRLLVFREVARRKSFSQAAEALHYSQSTMSHHVTQLEVDVGARLFERHPGGRVLLTTAGQALLARTEDLLHTAAEAEAEVAAIVEGRSRHIRMGAFAVASATFLPAAIGNLHRLYPEVTVMVWEGESGQLLQDLEDKTLDVAVVFDDPHQPLPIPLGITHRHLFEEELLLALPREHRLSAREMIAVDELSEERWIAGTTRTSKHTQLLLRACHASGFEPNISVHTSSFLLSQRMVAAGIGVALVPEMSTTWASPNVVRRPLDPAPTRRLGIASRSAGDEPEPYQAVINLLIRDCMRCAPAGSDRNRR